MKKVNMERIRQVLQLVHEGLGYKKIQRQIPISTGYLSKLSNRIKELGLQPKDILSKTDAEISSLLYPPKVGGKASPDFSSLASEDVLSTVTAKVAYKIYAEALPEDRRLCYSSFCNKFNAWKRDQGHFVKYSNFINKPAEKCEIDYAGQTIKWKDCHGNLITSQIFVAAMPYSGLVFAYATSRQRREDWLEGLIAAFHYFGGVPGVVSTDNSRAMVIKRDSYGGLPCDLVKDVCEYYGTEFFACKIRSPKQKNMVERSVGLVERNILDLLRIKGPVQFHDIKALNARIQCMCDELNNQSMQGQHYGHTRRELFEADERALLQALPDRDFSIGSCWKEVLVGQSRLVRFKETDDSMHYFSVPYEYQGKRIYLYATKEEVRFSDLSFSPICSHARTLTSQRHVLPEHMTEAEKAQSRTKEDYIDRLEKAGLEADVVGTLLDAIWMVPEPSARKNSDFLVKACMSLKESAPEFGKRLCVAVENDIPLNKSALEEHLNCLRTCIRQGLPLDSNPVSLDPAYQTPTHQNIRGNYE